MPKIVYDIEFKVKGGKSISDSLKAVDDSGLKDVEKQANKANNAIFSISEQAENVGTSLKQSSVDGVKALNAVKSASKQLEQQQRITNQTTKSTSKITSGANQVFFSFSDGVQDAAQFQFGFAQGMRAIGNNVSFTAELLAQLNRNAKATGITLGQALRQSLSGVGGALLALNLVISASTILMGALGKKTKETNEEIDNLFTQLGNISGADDGLLVSSEDLLVRLDQRIELLQSEQAALDQLAAFRGTTGITTDQDRRGQTETLKSLRLIRDEIAKQPEFIRNLTEEQQESIKKRIDSQIEELELTRLQRQALASLVTEEEKRASIERARSSVEKPKKPEDVVEDIVDFKEPLTLQELIDEGDRYAQSIIDNEKKITDEQANEIKNRKTNLADLAFAAATIAQGLFSNDKDAAIATATIQGALAVQRAYGAAPPPFGAILAAGVAAATAKQIATIKNTEIGSSSSVSAPSGQGSGSNGFGGGFRETSLAQPDGFAPSFLPSGSFNTPPINITLSGEFDSEILSIKAEQGDRLRRANVITVGN